MQRSNARLRFKVEFFTGPPPGGCALRLRMKVLRRFVVMVGTLRPAKKSSRCFSPDTVSVPSSSDLRERFPRARYCSRRDWRIYSSFSFTFVVGGGGGG